MNEHMQRFLGYGTGAISFLAGILSLNVIATIIGIVVALGTFGVNYWLAVRRDRRETRMLEYRLGQKVNRRREMIPVRRDKRTTPVMCSTCPAYQFDEDATNL